MARIRGEAQALLPRAGARAHNRDAFLNAIDGLAYDDDPAEGVVQGSSFRHGGLQLALAAPAGYALNNGAEALTGRGPNGANFELRAADARAGDLYAIAAARWQQLGVRAQPMQATSINGLDAVTGSIRAGTNQGPVDATLTVYRWTPQLAFTLIVIAPQGQAEGIAPVAASVRKLSAQEIGAIRTRRIQVVRVGANDTVQGLAARMAYDDDRLARFLTLNQLASDARLQAGDRIKLVVWR